MTNQKKELLIVWTSKDIDVAMNMVFMYARNARIKGWWDEVFILIWGPSAYAMAKDTELQECLKDLQEAGVKTLACRKCAENYGVVKNLEELDIDVFYAGQFLSEWIQEDKKVLTF